MTKPAMGAETRAGWPTRYGRAGAGHSIPGRPGVSLTIRRQRSPRSSPECCVVAWLGPEPPLLSLSMRVAMPIGMVLRPQHPSMARRRSACTPHRPVGHGFLAVTVSWRNRSRHPIGLLFPAEIGGTRNHASRRWICPRQPRGRERTRESQAGTSRPGSS